DKEPGYRLCRHRRARLRDGGRRDAGRARAAAGLGIERRHRRRRGRQPLRAFRRHHARRRRSARSRLLRVDHHRVSRRERRVDRSEEGRLTMAPSGLVASRRARAWIALLCIGLLLAAINIIAGRFANARLDLTREGLYTLSGSTRLTLAHIDEPVTLRLYYSTRLGDSVPAYGVYAQRVRELLDEYVAAAHGKLRLETYNPQPFSDIEDRAVAFGLQAVPLDEQGEQVFFGLAGTNSTDDQQVIPFFSQERERLLEYDLTRLVHNLAVP